MAAKQQLEFIIRLDGSVEEQLAGVAGNSCEEVTRSIELHLGAIVDRKHTPDYFASKQETGESATVQS